MALTNGREVSLDLVPGRSSLDSHVPETKKMSVIEQLNIVFALDMLLKKFVLCWTCFYYNIVLYGCFFAFPQIMPDLHIREPFPAAYMLALGAIREIPCDVIGVICSMRLHRKYTLSIFFIGLIASTVLFLAGVNASNSTLVLIGYYGLKGFPQIGSIALYVYAAELYPIEARSTGTAAVLGFGRLGAILASVLYGFLLKQWGNIQAFFRVCILLTISSMLVVIFLPETRPWATERAEGGEALHISPWMSIGLAGSMLGRH